MSGLAFALPVTVFLGSIQLVETVASVIKNAVIDVGVTIVAVTVLTPLYYIGKLMDKILP